MNSAQQAKNGFKTFILTFSISLVVFGFIYYVVSDAAIADIGIEDSSTGLGQTTTLESGDRSFVPDVVRSSDGLHSDASVLGTEDTSPFGEMLVQEPTVRSRTTGVVLAAEDENTETGAIATSGGAATESTEVPESTVPETGVTGMTVGLVGSVSLFAIFAYMVLLNPRRYAYSKFEHGMLDES